VKYLKKLYKEALINIFFKKDNPLNHLIVVNRLVLNEEILNMHGTIRDSFRKSTYYIEKIRESK
jgi:hypothetical protein